jgi:hypothetical protein
MELSDLLGRLRALAQDVGLEVRELHAAAPGELPPGSGVCRVRGRTWVLLAASDGLEQRIEVLAQALRTHAGPALEGRYLPPAVRERLAKGRADR